MSLQINKEIVILATNGRIVSGLGPGFFLLGSQAFCRLIAKVFFERLFTFIISGAEVHIGEIYIVKPSLSVDHPKSDTSRENIYLSIYIDISARGLDNAFPVGKATGNPPQLVVGAPRLE